MIDATIRKKISLTDRIDITGNETPRGSDGDMAITGLNGRLSAGGGGSGGDVRGEK